MRKALFAAVLSAALAAAPAAHAQALPACSDAPEQRTVLSGQGQLESIIADARGRLFYTDLQNGGRLLRVEKPGATPKVLKTGINGTGGLAWEPDGSLILGENGGNQNAIVDGPAGGLWRVNPETGESTRLAGGMGMANGIVRGPDGAIYASNDFAGGIDRVVGGKVEDDWSKVATPNGLVIDTAGRYLYAAQTFKPASVARIDLRDPSKEEPYYEAPPPDLYGGPDGMTRDDHDRLFVAINAVGQVWRIDRDRTACVLATGIGGASALNWGGDGDGFPARNLYVVGFSGVLVELANATDAPPPAGPPATAMRLTVSPKRVNRLDRTRFRARVISNAGAPVAGATFRIGNRRATTDSKGRASVVVRFFHPGTKSARATHPAYRSVTKKVAVSRAATRAPPAR